MKLIQVLGPGCRKCRKLAENAAAAAALAGDPCTVQRITDLSEILKFDVSATPALVVDGKVVAAGWVPSIDELKKWIR